MADENRFLSIPEAAARLGVSRIAVFKKVKKGRLAAIRIGRNWAIPISALETAAAGAPRAVRQGPAPAPARAIIPPPPQPAARKPPVGAAKKPLIVAPNRTFKAKTDSLEELGWD